jgi:hypothetical protein
MAARDLLERLLRSGTKRIGHHATERYVRTRTGKAFGTRQLDCHHSEALDVAWMPDAANRNPVANLKNLSPITPKGQKQYSIGEAKTDCGTSVA